MHCALRRAKVVLHKSLSWFPLYRVAMGGYWYYKHVQDRTYEPGQFCSYGKNADIGDNVIIRCPENMKIGDEAHVAADCFIDAAGGFQMGNYSCMGRHTVVLTTDHQFDGDCIPFNDTRIVKPVVIGDFVWVGRDVAVLPGVRIGEGAIVGLGAVVRQDVPPCAIVIGAPARVVGYRDKGHFCCLKDKGAVRPPGLGRRRFWIPPEIREKYPDLLGEVGFNVCAGNEDFEWAPRK